MHASGRHSPPASEASGPSVGSFSGAKRWTVAGSIVDGPTMLFLMYARRAFSLEGSFPFRSSFRRIYERSTVRSRNIECDGHYTFGVLFSQLLFDFA
jgi:hypothetical protein